MKHFFVKWSICIAPIVGAIGGMLHENGYRLTGLGTILLAMTFNLVVVFVAWSHGVDDGEEIATICHNAKGTEP